MFSRPEDNVGEELADGAEPCIPFVFIPPEKGNTRFTTNKPLLFCHFLGLATDSSGKVIPSSIPCYHINAPTVRESKPCYTFLCPQ